METSKKNFRVIPEKQTCLRRLQVLRSHVDPVFDCHEKHPADGLQRWLQSPLLHS